jgi:hypothetical protein
VNRPWKTSPEQRGAVASPSEPRRERSRRTRFLRGLALVGLGAVLTPAIAYAGDGDAIVAGGLNGATRTTVLAITGSGEGGSALRTLADGANFGVSAESVRGTAVQGVARAPGTSGVAGINSDDGVGVTGVSDAPGGIGVLARSSGGIALRVQGELSLKRAGKLRVPAGRRSFTQTGVALAPNSLVIATVQRYRRGVWIQTAAPDAVSDSFTVVLNKAPGKRTPVAWFVLN